MTERNIILCRLCLAVQNNLNVINGIQTDMLQIVLPNLDVNISQFALICNGCAGTLNQAFMFKSSVLEIENKLHNYTNDGQKQVDLEDILEVQEIEEMTENQIKTRLVCRTCLRRQKDHLFVVLSEDNNDILIVLETCLPEMNTKMTKQPVVCPTCVNTLENMSSFITLCMDNQNKIKRYLKTQLVATQLREPQNDIGRSEDIIVIRDESEKNAKKYNTRKSNSKTANTKSTEVETDEIDDNVAEDPDYEMDEDSCEYDSDLDGGEIQGAQVQKSKRKEQNECPISVGNGHGGLGLLPRLQPRPVTSNRSPFIYCKYCPFKALDESTFELHKFRCQINQMVIMRNRGRTKRRKVLKELHTNVTEERDLNVAKNTRKEQPATTTGGIEPIEDTEDIECVISEDSVTLSVRRGRITDDEGIEEEGENNESIVQRERNDLVISNKLDTCVTDQSPTPHLQNSDFVEITILKCHLCGFNTRSLSKIKDHLTSHCFDSYFAQYNFGGYKEIFYCGKCIRSFYDKDSLQDHDCVNNTKVNVAQFKVGVVSYCMRCSFETDEDDVFLSHKEQCTDQ